MIKYEPEIAFEIIIGEVKIIKPTIKKFSFNKKARRIVNNTAIADVTMRKE